MAEIEVGSTWVAGSAALTTRNQWWLKDPLYPALNMAIEVADYSATVPKPQEVAYGAGADGATVIHQGVRLMVHKVKIRTLSAAAYASLRALLDSGRTLILESVFGDSWKVQLGESTEVQIIRAHPVAGETSPIRDARFVNCTFTEVER